DPPPSTPPGTFATVTAGPHVPPAPDAPPAPPPSTPPGTFATVTAGPHVPPAPDAPPAPDIIILDPPRKGCDAACLEAIARIAPRQVIYVSCDSATLARDLRFLADQGYRPARIRCVDMFPQTVHIETVVSLWK
ncbi:MAG: hypothetical protein LBR77_02810, partial [Lachnospiraceae bacterium]|nr:hypothetical protein [Lachnospiraceae bacterium]